MNFVQGIRLDNVNVRDQQHGLTKAYNKGKTFFKAVSSIVGVAGQVATPLANILASAGVFSTKPDMTTHIKKGIVLSCVVIRTPTVIGKTALHTKKATKKKGADLAEDVTKIASNVASIALGIMVCFQLGDTIVALCGALSGSLGLGFKVAQGGISTMLPFIGVFSAIEITKGLLEIGVEGIKLYKTAKKIHKTKKKIKTWKNMDWTDPTYISAKLERMKVKQIKTKGNLDNLEGALATSVLAFNSQVLHVDKRWAKLDARKLELSDRNPVVRLFGQVAPQIKLTVALVKKEELEKKHLRALAVFNKVSSKHTVRTVKIRNYTIIEGKIRSDTLTARDKVALKYLQESQVAKLKVKKSNLKFVAYEHSFKIALKTLVVITLVASLALTFSGFGTMPGIITGASVALFVMVAEYGLKKFKHYYPPKAWIPVHVPSLSKRPTEELTPTVLIPIVEI